MADEINWAALDYSDPCALLAVLRPKYFQLVAGDSALEIEIDGRRLKMSQGSISKLEAVINQLEADCKAASSGRRVRRAATSRHLR